MYFISLNSNSFQCNGIQKITEIKKALYKQTWPHVKYSIEKKLQIKNIFQIIAYFIYYCSLNNYKAVLPLQTSTTFFLLQNTKDDIFEILKVNWDKTFFDIFYFCVPQKKASPALLK